MNNKTQNDTGWRSAKKSLLVITIVALSIGCKKSNVDDHDLKDFQQINLVANDPEYHPRTTLDPTLQNAFGIAWSSSGIAWVNSVGGHVSELYTSEGAIFRPPVSIPFSRTDLTHGLPCGIVNSTGMGFNLPNGASSFLFSGFDGVLSGWNGASGTQAQFLRKPNNASYTGLAIGTSKNHNFIYGANFGQSKIDVWDDHFNLVSMPFRDPNLPSGYSPYNIQAVGNYLFVVYDKLGPTGHPVVGPGLGFVSIFNTDGSFVQRLASRGTLNAPWGVTAAPGSFLEKQDINDDGKYSNHNSKDDVILIGNFGDGHINVYGQDGKFLGQLQSHKQPIVIEGLWALSFPPTSSGIDKARLYFTAGPDEEADGVFGYLIKR